jgi:hypothetical protein
VRQVPSAPPPMIDFGSGENGIATFCKAPGEAMRPVYVATSSNENPPFPPSSLSLFILAFFLVGDWYLDAGDEDETALLEVGLDAEDEEEEEEEDDEEGWSSLNKHSRRLGEVRLLAST